MRRRKTYRKTCSKKQKIFCRGKNLPYAKNGRVYFEIGFLIRALISAATCFLGPALLKIFFKEMRRKYNYIMMKRATPKRVTLPDGFDSNHQLL